jgi:malate dehydrogenase (quinone)
MSVPHLDARIVEGQHSVLFGPYAGFSTRFLKHGKLTDLFDSLSIHNLVPLLDVARDNIDLSEYLVGQLLQSSAHQFETLKQFYPTAARKDWREAIAGQRVQTIKPHEATGWFKHEAGALQFGTEVVAAADKSIVALLGASPGASTGAFIALNVLQKCFDDRLTPDGWLPRLKTIIPTYGIDLKTDAAACRTARAETAAILKIKHI